MSRVPPRAAAAAAAAAAASLRGGARDRARRPSMPAIAAARPRRTRSTCGCTRTRALVDARIAAAASDAAAAPLDCRRDETRRRARARPRPHADARGGGPARGGRDPLSDDGEKVSGFAWVEWRDDDSVGHRVQRPGGAASLTARDGADGDAGAHLECSFLCTAAPGATYPLANDSLATRKAFVADVSRVRGCRARDVGGAAGRDRGALGAPRSGAHAPRRASARAWPRAPRARSVVRTNAVVLTQAVLGWIQSRGKSRCNLFIF